MDGRTENLPILQDFVPYRGRCPKSGKRGRRRREVESGLGESKEVERGVGRHIELEGGVGRHREVERGVARTEE